MNKERFDPHYYNYAGLAVDAGIEIDTTRLSSDSRLDSVRKLGETLENAVSQSSDNPNLGFLTIFEFRDAFQEPLRQFGYEIAEERDIQKIRQTLLTGISQVAEELRWFAYNPRQDYVEKLGKFCSSLYKHLSLVRSIRRHSLSA